MYEPGIDIDLLVSLLGRKPINIFTMMLNYSYIMKHNLTMTVMSATLSHLYK